LFTREDQELEASSSSGPYLLNQLGVGQRLLDQGGQDGFVQRVHGTGRPPERSLPSVLQL
jgi:hypothetical protein